MTTEHDKNSMKKSNDHCMKLANEKFGYHLGLNIALEKLGIGEVSMDRLAELAKLRNIEEFERSLEEELRVVELMKVTS